MTVGQAGFDERIVAPLLRDLGVLDEARAKALREPELRTKHVRLAAAEHTLQPEVHRLGIPARHERLVHPRDLLVVGVGATRQCRGPVAVGDRVERIPPVGPEAFVAELQILARADVENVVQAERIVDADAEVALQLAGRARAGIVDRGDNGPWLHALYADHDIALARYICRLDLHVDVLAGDALHLLKALLQVAQVQQFIAACRKRRFPGATCRRIGESQLPDDAGHKRELQFAMRQVLLG
ncbi:hypothetical protein R69658_08049 [Paraburkholderia aspalathi]|uniref:Uncharacterized protein n=1 Tax=Paraburkholderia aspalathi TaxID=1324617 RepID=A0ABN7NA63_9BURK|nr:hypothetical protein R69658_08049 [Paraburkholderia aspalathi]